MRQTKPVQQPAYSPAMHFHIKALLQLTGKLIKCDVALLSNPVTYPTLVRFKFAAPQTAWKRLTLKAACLALQLDHVVDEFYRNLECKAVARCVWPSST
jgi:hypothetical protein